MPALGLALFCPKDWLFTIYFGEVIAELEKQRFLKVGSSLVPFVNKFPYNIYEFQTKGGCVLNIEAAKRRLTGR